MSGPPIFSVATDLSESRTLSEQLALRVAQSLVQAGLLRPERQDSIAAQIASGKIKSSEWQREIEMAADQGARS